MCKYIHEEKKGEYNLVPSLKKNVSFLNQSPNNIYHLAPNQPSP